MGIKQNNENLYTTKKNLKNKHSNPILLTFRQCKTFEIEITVKHTFFLKQLFAVISALFTKPLLVDFSLFISLLCI